MSRWKEVVPANDVLRSLLHLRDELWERCIAKELSMDEETILLKINSCLYSMYPVTPRKKDKQDEYR